MENKDGLPIISFENQQAWEAWLVEHHCEYTNREGERFPAKHSRTGFRRNFSFESAWRGIFYNTKQTEVFAVRERND